MSFTSMHNDHLDPDRAGLNDDDWGKEFEIIRTMLDKYDTGRWQWDRITCCLTGKDADLEAWGQQGIELVGVSEDGIEIVVHGYKTVVGTDVCLNLEPEIEEDDEAYEKACEQYLETAHHVVAGSNSTGEWDGDSWGMTLRETVEVPWVYGDDGVTPDYDATFDSILNEANKVIDPWETEMSLIDKYTNQLAGWIDQDDKRCEFGKPSKLAAWHQV